MKTKSSDWISKEKENELMFFIRYVRVYQIIEILLENSDVKIGERGI